MAILLSIFLLLWAAPQPSTQPPDQADAEQSKILALENAWNQAEGHKDVRAREGRLDSTLVYIDYDGSIMDKAQFIASVQAPSLHPEAIVNESMSAQV